MRILARCETSGPGILAMVTARWEESRSEELMTGIHLRPIDRTNLAACLAPRVHESQVGFVANNARSLAEAYVNPSLVPLAVYPESARGWGRRSSGGGGIHHV